MSLSHCRVPQGYTSHHGGSICYRWKAGTRGSCAATADEGSQPPGNYGSPVCGLPESYAPPTERFLERKGMQPISTCQYSVISQILCTLSLQ